MQQVCRAASSFSAIRIDGCNDLSIGATMYRVSREFSFCYGHRLLDYQGKCRHLHGHNGRAVLTLEAQELDRLGMVMDFSHIKRVVNSWIDETLDHRMILHQ